MDFKQGLRRELIEIDLSDVSDSKALHELLKEALGFPSFYGNNWAAFWDSITGLIEMPIRLRLNGWQQFQQRMSHDARCLCECLKDASNEFPEFASEVEYS